MTAAPIGAEIQLVPSTKEITLEYLPKGHSELPDAVGVNDGVDGGVGVREDDGDVHDEAGFHQLSVEEREAVEDVNGQPAESEQAHDDGQGFGGADLALKQAAVMTVAVAGAALQLDLAQLLARHREDLGVDAQHDEQRRQHATEEVEVNHVAHVHHVFKQTLEAAALQEARFARAVAGRSRAALVPRA